MPLEPEQEKRFLDVLAKKGLRECPSCKARNDSQFQNLSVGEPIELDGRNTKMIHVICKKCGFVSLFRDEELLRFFAS